MAWFGGKKKKAKKSPPVLEPVGNPAVQAAPAAQTAPAVQAAPAIQPIPAAQPVVEVAPVGVVADANISVSTDANQNNTSKEWSKKSNKPLFDIHKKLDFMMDSKGKSLEDRYNERFGDKLPESVAADSARKEYNEKHIKSAMFWDVDEHSDKKSLFPHMMNNSDYWKKMLCSFEGQR